MEIKNYIAKPQQDTPEINFSIEKQKLFIAGKSFAEDVVEFYTPLIKWIDNYFATKPEKQTILEFKMTYFSTATSKVFLDLLIKLETYSKKGMPVKILWNYADKDEDIMESGEEYAEMVQLPFELKSYEIEKKIPNNNFEEKKRSA